MYVPPASREDRVEVLHRAIEELRFGTLVTVGPQGPIATHLPMFVDPTPAPYGRIFGHIARANPQWERSDPAVAALAAFVGPQAYITPSWYETKKLTGKVVPTWQYIAVQARGPISFFHNADRLHDIVRRSTLRQEASRAHPWAVEDAPEDYVDKMLHAIVGFEIRVESIVGSWKLGQNKSEGDRNGMIEGLEESDQQALAELVRRHGAKET
jgi:transcriptional regulator